MQGRFTPELLAPAGNILKLKTAVLYGADAVYCAGMEYGLRAAADNFTSHELEAGVAFAHEHGSKVYVVLNGFLHDDDIQGLGNFVKFLKHINVDAVIVSDPGVAKVVREFGPIPIHVSTQASVLNQYAVRAWQELGATRVVVGRELSIAESHTLQNDTGLEMEMFVHGSMCMAYSGHCVISNFTQGRDSNRGGCAHSCRFSYDLQFEDGTRASSTFMSSKDLEGLTALTDFVEKGIVSLKVEGRMKGPLYAATTTRVYRLALDHWREHGDFKNAPWTEWVEELAKLPRRGATTASLMSPADAASIYDERDHDLEGWSLAGTIRLASPRDGILMECKQSFNRDAQLEIIPFAGSAIPLSALEMMGPEFDSLERTKPQSLVRFPWVEGAKVMQVVRIHKD